MTVTNLASPAGSMALRKQVVVNAPQAHCFDVFTARMGSWWPLLSHHIGKASAVDAILEPKAGGRWYERGDDGSECNWGTVLAWDPPGRLLLRWEISSEWQHDHTLKSEVEILFIAEGPERTRVELEHRKLDDFGDKAAMMVEQFNGEGGWTYLMQRFALGAEGRPMPVEEATS